jgi:hypothetical protein
MFGAIGRSRMVLESLCWSSVLQLDYVDLAHIYTSMVIRSRHRHVSNSMPQRILVFVLDESPPKSSSSALYALNPFACETSAPSSAPFSVYTQLPAD